MCGLRLKHPAALHPLEEARAKLEWQRVESERRGVSTDASSIEDLPATPSPTFSPDSEVPRFHGGNTRVEAPRPPPAMTHHHEPDTDPRRLRALGELLARGIRRLDDIRRRTTREEILAA